ncbi:MAG: hypothetical protein CMJ31_10955 [Phycisphaerae bacterium]|nr:hypothetical protein [Phycisphaerae bacterium]
MGVGSWELGVGSWELGVGDRREGLCAMPTRSAGMAHRIAHGTPDCAGRIGLRGAHWVARGTADGARRRRGVATCPCSSRC